MLVPICLPLYRPYPMLSARDLIDYLGLRPLPREGGYYAETYRSVLSLAPSALPDAYDGPRHAATAIYYLLTPDTFSALHRLPGDEVYHFYLGDPVELLLLHPSGGEVRTLGQAITQGMHLQTVVPGGVWQGSRLRAGGAWALLGTTMAPGFDFADFEAPDPSTLRAQYPAFSDWIEDLTR